MRNIIIVSVCVVALIVAAVVTFRYVDRTQAQPVRDLSKMMSVQHLVSEALAAHYKQHDSYPRLLGELPLQSLPWGDEGSSARDVEAWFYVSDGSSFTMTWTNATGTELFLAGKTGQVYFSRDERR